MARARNIKPGFYKNEDLAECSIWARFIFPGLWMLADREGRLEDRPKRIKGELLPFDSQDAEPLLRELEARGFIVRYQIDGASFIQISKFSTHQAPHYSEKPSTIKPPILPESLVDDGIQKPENSGKEAQIKRGSQPPDSLIPDSLIPSSLNPDSPTVDSPNEPKSKPLQPAAPAAPKKKAPLTDEETAFQAVCRETWGRYSEAYAQRYGAMPIRNAKINGQVRQFCQRVPASEAPAIAGFFVRHNAAFYVSKGHAIGQLLSDAEKLRTEWATNQTITTTQAQQADKTQANGNVWGKVIAGIEERDRNAAVS
jgi:hypothetical protein